MQLRAEPVGRAPQSVSGVRALRAVERHAPLPRRVVTITAARGGSGSTPRKSAAVTTAASTSAAVQTQQPELSAAQRTPAWVEGYGHNKALAGNFAPVEREVLLRGVQVTGVLPAHLNGVYLRNGPNPAFEPRQGYHWFDGNGMVHFVRLRPEDQTADYGCRYVRSRGFLEEEKAGKRLYVSITEPPLPEEIVRGLVSKAQNWRRPDAPYWVIQQINSANNGLTFHAGKLLATYEAGSAHELRLTEQLECEGVCDFKGTWSTKDFWLQNFTAHPKKCPSTGELVYIGYNLVPTDGVPSVTVGVVAGDGAVSRRIHVPCARPSMQHDVAITRTRTVLLDGPLIFNIDKSLQGGRPFDFDMRKPCRFGVMDRYTEDASGIKWMETDACYNYHVMNAWDHPEHPHRVVLVTCRSAMTGALGMADIRTPQFDGDQNHGVLKECVEEATLHRFVLDIELGRVVESTPMCTIPSEFPCVNPNFVGLPTRYGYTAGIRQGVQAGAITLFDAVVKHDLTDGSMVRRALPDGCLCGDILFVADPAQPHVEDAGHLLVLCHREQQGDALLLVLDARHITAEPAATVHIPVRVPFGFHCEYVHGGALPLWK